MENNFLPAISISEAGSWQEMQKDIPYECFTSNTCIGDQLSLKFFILIAPWPLEATQIASFCFFYLKRNEIVIRRWR